MRALLILAIVLCAATGPAPAQRYHREGGYAPKLPPNEAFDRGFFVCRMMYTSVLREAGGIGWQTDYPYSEINRRLHQRRGGPAPHLPAQGRIPLGRRLLGHLRMGALD